MRGSLDQPGPQDHGLLSSPTLRSHGYPGTRNALWYWLWGTALTLTTLYAGVNLGLGWSAIPISWLPTLTVAYLLKPRRGTVSVE